MDCDLTKTSPQSMFTDLWTAVAAHADDNERHAAYCKDVFDDASEDR